MYSVVVVMLKNNCFEFEFDLICDTASNVSKKIKNVVLSKCKRNHAEAL